MRCRAACFHVIKNFTFFMVPYMALDSIGFFSLVIKRVVAVLPAMIFSGVLEK